MMKTMRGKKGKRGRRTGVCEDANHRARNEGIMNINPELRDSAPSW
jgi:hypothetical protein